MFSLSVYIKEIKKASLNKKISNEEFVRQLLSTVVIPAKITLKNGEEFDLNKSRVSRLLSGKDDVPSALREALMQYGIEDKIKDEFQCFCDDYLCSESLQASVSALNGIIQNDNIITEESKTEFQILLHSPIDFLAVAFIMALKLDNRSENQKNIIWQRGINNISVIEGDLFKYGFENRKKQKNIIVIPVNTSFDTHITKNTEKEQFPLVSDTTLHGKWLQRFLHSGNSTDVLDKRIEISLQNQGLSSTKNSLTKSGKQYSYPVGTTAIIENQNAIYYLLAISSFSDCNVAKSSKEKIKIALRELLKLYNEHGQGYPLYLPLIGTGRSRAGLDFQESYDLIITVLQENLDYIQGEITIVIQPSIIHQINTERRI